MKLRHLFQSSGARTLAQLGIKDTESWTNPPSTLPHARSLPGGTYSPWLADTAFLRIFRKVQKHTLVDIYRCYELWDLARQMNTVDGDILEVGVWRGGTGAILASAVSDTSKTVFLADTFSGVVKAGKHDPRYVGGEHSNTSISIVQELLSNLGLIQRARIMQGVFPEDTGNVIDGKLCLVHCDVDVYQSCKDIVEWCLPRLTVGGVIVFDDYGFSGCEGVTEYCNELKSQGSLRFIYNLNGHAIFLRLS